VSASVPRTDREFFQIEGAKELPPRAVRVQMGARLLRVRPKNGDAIFLAAIFGAGLLHNFQVTLNQGDDLLGLSCGRLPSL